MNLTERPDWIVWPETDCVFIEKIGPFQTTARLAWQELHGFIPVISQSYQITKYMALYKMEPGRHTYRAGLALASAPGKLPLEMGYEKFEGGKYSRFVLKGSYAQLPAACGRVFEIVKETMLKLREGFYIEHYVNDPRTTPESELVTEILVPTL